MEVEERLLEEARKQPNTYHGAYNIILYSSLAMWISTIKLENIRITEKL